jgi:hypothetical protein
VRRRVTTGEIDRYYPPATIVLTYELKVALELAGVFGVLAARVRLSYLYTRSEIA